MAKLLGVVLWIITFIDFYGAAPAAVRYILCLFPNAGLLFCIQVLQQFERRSSKLFDVKIHEPHDCLGGMATFEHLYVNIFDYPLYIGVCLLLMLIYSVIYMFLAVYVERLNPGEFGVSQSWNYWLKKSYWTSSSSVRPTDAMNNIDQIDNHGGNANHWIEMNQIEKKKSPAMTIDHLNKVRRKNDRLKLYNDFFVC